MLTPALIKRFAPGARADIVAGLVAGWPKIHAAGIVTPLRLQHFMTVTATETGGLRLLEENLSYTAERLCQVWPRRFKSLEAARPFARNPAALAEKVYGGRLGNTQPGDGWRFRGRSLIHTTGRANYEAAGVAGDPDAIGRMPGALDAALAYWTANNLNAVADRGPDPLRMRRAVNLGNPASKAMPVGLDHARTYMAKAIALFTVIGEPSVPLVRTNPPARRLPVPIATDAGPAPESYAEGAYHLDVEVAQRRLVELGYHMVGEVDGKPGKRTASALTAFQLAAGLPLTATLDPATKAALSGEDAPRMPLSPERLGATIESLAPKLPELRKAGRLETLGKVVLGGAAGLPALGALDWLGEITNRLAPLREFVASLTGWPLLLAVGLLLAAAGWFIWRQAAEIAELRVADHREGRTA